MAHHDEIESGRNSDYKVSTQVIVAFVSIALYNVLELNFVIFNTFKRRSGLYFWSFLIATWGIVPNAVGYLLKHLSLTKISNLYSTLIIVGWCSMVTGQSVVLYSRLHLVTRNPTALRAVLIMIIFDAIVLHIPVIVLVYGSNSEHPGRFIHPYSIYEKLQLTVFFVQETAISGLYIWETVELLKSEIEIRGKAQAKRVMNHLICINIAVILLNVSVLTLEFTNHYNVQTAYKPLVYSIKLKMEFGILNRLVELTQGSTDGSFYLRSTTDLEAGVSSGTTAPGDTGNTRWTGQRSDETQIIGTGNDVDIESRSTDPRRAT